MLDRDLVAGHDDALDQEPHEALAAGEVEVGQALAQRGRERRELRGRPLQPLPVALGGGQGLGPRPEGRRHLVQALAPCRELREADRAVLVGIEQSLKLPLQLPVRLVDLRPLPRHRLRRRATGLPGVEFLDEQAWSLEPPDEFLPHDRFEIDLPHPPRVQRSAPPVAVVSGRPQP